MSNTLFRIVPDSEGGYFTVSTEKASYTNMDDIILRIKCKLQAYFPGGAGVGVSIGGASAWGVIYSISQNGQLIATGEQGSQLYRSELNRDFSILQWNIFNEVTSTEDNFAINMGPFSAGQVRFDVQVAGK